jgi:H+-translocating NAD(P) transhydrogenase subunit alpha
MNREDIARQSEELSNTANQLLNQLSQLTDTISSLPAPGGHEGGFVMLLTIFALACFVGYFVVWKVTPALHSPLMGVTNAISSVIIVGALLALGPVAIEGLPKWLAFVAVILASINIFGGFVVTQRMLDMFKKKQK